MQTIKLVKNCLLTVAVFAGFYSCSERETINTEIPPQASLKPSGPPTPCYIVSTEGSQNNLFPDIKAINMANGVPFNTKNSILVFPSMDSYRATIDALDTQVDNHNAAFDLLTNGMTDEQADAYAESTGFDEDKPITDFENTFQFGSLRKKLITLENQWLDQQGDGSWNLETDPDSYYVDDDTERALLNEQSEVLIGTCEAGYTLYKIYSWGNVHIPVSNFPQLTDVLTQLNAGNYPLALPININGISQANVVTILNNTPLVCPTLTTSGGPSSCFVTTNPTNDPALSCKSYVKDKGEYLFSSSRRIKWKHKFKEEGFPYPSNNAQKLKVTTASFKKKSGGWKKYRATLYSGLTGQLSDNNCNLDNGNNTNGKEKRKQRLKYTWTLPGLVSRTKENKFFSVHKQEGNAYQNDIY